MTQLTEAPVASPVEAVVRPQRSRIVVAAIAVVIPIAMAFAVFMMLPGRASSAGITSDEHAAMDAAGTSLVNLLSYSRTSFDADYDRAVAGTTGKLRDDIASAKDQTLKAMTSGNFELAAKLDTTGLVTDQSGDTTEVLAVVSGWSVNDSGKQSQPKYERVEMTMQQVDGQWLASDLAVPDGVWRPESSTDARSQVVSAGTSCLATMNTYTYTAVAATKAKGLACTAGSFTDRYSQSFDDVAAAATKAKSSQTFEITGAGLQSLDGDQAKLLVFAQVETTVANKSPQYGVLSAEVTMQKVDNTWKVTGYRTSP